MQEKTKKQGWIRSVISSIKDFDRYEEFAVDTTSNSIKYFLLLVLLFVIIIYALFIYKFNISDIDGIGFFKKNILNLDYEIEQMQILSVDDIIIENKNNVIIPIWIFILYLTIFLVDALILAGVGYLIALIYRIKLRYKVTFNIAVHALTLPIVLNLIYIITNSIFGFEIKYFQLMYTTISYIYMIVAILMIKTDIINRQMELIKIEKEQLKVRNEINEKEKEDKNQEEDKNKENEDGKELKDRGNLKDNVNNEPEESET